ncbi:uncharacterized protein LOC106151229 [Lingula anatina]|uniref:Uncharacterized protein LOC106151229 n=1 Tax=Lingula anatina TaxID=7574 RepID=A0A1S3H101_LINAN|nr:uncharacterized protein LOC106151229 [Lingula anatina]|eukprot:XP_013379820.1 uncharacterized protein LOC106151229 [Lingula anatina]
MASRLLLTRCAQLRQFQGRPQYPALLQITKTHKRESHGDSKHGHKTWRDDPEELAEENQQAMWKWVLYWSPFYIVTVYIGFMRNEEEHHEKRQPYRPYAATCIRKKPLRFWDGDHSLFFSPQRNWTSKGYDEEQHLHH